jgi:hypothetical protein
MIIWSVYVYVYRWNESQPPLSWELQLITRKATCCGAAVLSIHRSRTGVRQRQSLNTSRESTTLFTQTKLRYSVHEIMERWSLETKHSFNIPWFASRVYRICACISRNRFCLCESKIFAIAFAALWLSLAAFTVICQWCRGLPTSANRWCRLLSCNENRPKHR